MSASASYSNRLRGDKNEGRKASADWPKQLLEHAATLVQHDEFYLTITQQLSAKIELSRFDWLFRIIPLFKPDLLGGTNTRKLVLLYFRIIPCPFPIHLRLNLCGK